MAFIEVSATLREETETGSSASRRMRARGRVPGVLYGSKRTNVLLSLDHKDLLQSMRAENFHSSILHLKIDNGLTERVLLREVQTHPYKQQILSFGFEYVAADKKITFKVPLRFTHEESCPAVKLSGALVSHVMNELDIVCLPDDLPTHIEVDLSNLEVGHPLHVNSITMPTGVTPLHQAENPVVVTAKVSGQNADDSSGEASAGSPAAAPTPPKK